MMIEQDKCTTVWHENSGEKFSLNGKHPQQAQNNPVLLCDHFKNTGLLFVRPQNPLSKPTVAQTTHKGNLQIRQDTLSFAQRRVFHAKEFRSPQYLRQCAAISRPPLEPILNAFFSFQQILQIRHEHLHFRRLNAKCGCA